MPGRTLVFCLQAFSLLGSLLMAIKVYRSGLYRRYRIFFLYFIFRVFNSLWPLFMSVRSPTYFRVWVFTEPLVWIFYVGVVLELCELVLERHKGLYTLGRWALYFSMALSVGLSVLSLFPRIKPSQRSGIIAYIFPTDRGITLCLAIFLILMLLLLSRYPVPLSRNVILHTTLYTVFFLSNTLGIILSSVFGVGLYHSINTGLMVVSCACVYSWLFFLNIEGEEVRVNAMHFSHEYEERLLYQLDCLDATLLRVSRI